MCVDASDAMQDDICLPMMGVPFVIHDADSDFVSGRSSFSLFICFGALCDNMYISVHLAE